jgi:hypothetical protein
MVNLAHVLRNDRNWTVVGLVGLQVVGPVRTLNYKKRWGCFGRLDRPAVKGTGTLVDLCDNTGLCGNSFAELSFKRSICTRS